MFVLIIFILAWMETFSKICIELSANCIKVEQAQKCVDDFKSLQNGLSVTFLFLFITLQTLVVLCFYMCIATLSFGPYNHYNNILLSISYATLFLYSGSILYFITTAAEATHSSLQKVGSPLNLMLVKEQDEETKMNIHLLIKEIETMPLLNGCGYFELKRGSLTSIVSNTVTYLIILLQFRNS